MIALIHYNAGNICSIRNALDRLHVPYLVTDDVESIQKADKVIFPGDGEASTTMAYLREKKLDIVIKNLQQPMLGICIGMQLLCTHSEENNTTCLGVFPYTVKKFSHEQGLKVPHMGWNSLHDVGKWLPETLANEYMYFVHSYYVPLGEHTAAACTYGIPFSAAIQKNNFYAAQFHPEKSAQAGVRVLESFLNL